VGFTNGESRDTSSHMGTCEGDLSSRGKTLNALAVVEPFVNVSHVGLPNGVSSRDTSISHIVYSGECNAWASCISLYSSLSFAVFFVFVSDLMIL
jgi:hypothetical protein